jgi:hypothetical protein
MDFSENLISRIENDKGGGLLGQLELLKNADFTGALIDSQTEYFKNFGSDPSYNNLKRSLQKLKTELGDMRFRWDDRSLYSQKGKKLQNSKNDLDMIETLLNTVDENRWKRAFLDKWKQMKEFYEDLVDGESIAEHLGNEEMVKKYRVLSERKFIDIKIEK